MNGRFDEDDQDQPEKILIQSKVTVVKSESIDNKEPKRSQRSDQVLLPPPRVGLHAEEFEQQRTRNT